MSINKLSHLKQWDKIYLEVTRKYEPGDDKDSIFFESKEDAVYVSNDDTFYTLEELKQLANDGMPNVNMPKQGEMVEVRDYECAWYKRIFVSFYKWKVLGATEFDGVSTWDEWRPLEQTKTELTLAEIEERLGLDAWSLLIK